MSSPSKRARKGSSVRFVNTINDNPALLLYTDVESPHKTLMLWDGIWQCLECGYWTRGTWETLTPIPCAPDDVERPIEEYEV